MSPLLQFGDCSLYSRVKQEINPFSTAFGKKSPKTDVLENAIEITYFKNASRLFAKKVKIYGDISMVLFNCSFTKKVLNVDHLHFK